MMKVQRDRKVTVKDKNRRLISRKGRRVKWEETPDMHQTCTATCASQFLKAQYLGVNLIDH
jgi:hypothetical protein